MPPLPGNDTVLPPWMRNLLTEEELKEIQEQQQIPLYIEPPMTKEQIVEESDIIEEEGLKRQLIEFDF
jgi:hypothetical protein